MKFEAEKMNDVNPSHVVIITSAVWTPLVGPNEEESDQPNTVENEDWPPNIESPEVGSITMLTMFYTT